MIGDILRSSFRVTFLLLFLYLHGKMTKKNDEIILGNQIHSLSEIGKMMKDNDGTMLWIRLGHQIHSLSETVDKMIQSFPKAQRIIVIMRKNEGIAYFLKIASKNVRELELELVEIMIHKAMRKKMEVTRNSTKRRSLQEVNETMV